MPYVLLQDYKTYDNLIAHKNPPINHKKQPPQEMSFMINFDGAIFKEQNTLGAEFLFEMIIGTSFQH